MRDKFSKCVDVKCLKRAGGDMAQNAQGMAEKAFGAVEGLNARVRDDLLPRAWAAGEAVTKAVSGDGTIMEKTEQASKGVKAAMKKKKCPIRHPYLATFLLLGAAAVAGFVLYSRSRPVEDPWAEESWEDIDDDDLVVVADSE